MTTIEKSSADIFFYWLVIVFAGIVLGRYGKQAMEWFLIKLYEFFIKGNTW
ncbi:hypothetical protein [Ferruginibacter profundus]